MENEKNFKNSSKKNLLNKLNLKKNIKRIIILMVIMLIILKIVSICLEFIGIDIPINVNVKYYMNKDFLEAGNKSGISYDETKEQEFFIQTYEEYTKLINEKSFLSLKLNADDFEKNNYLIIGIHYAGCSEQNIKPTNYEIDENKINITIMYEKHCGNCADAYAYFALKLEKNISNPVVSYEYKAVQKEKCNNLTSYKPLIYLYPTEEKNITVELGNQNLLTTTYPKYNGLWQVIAKPNGELTDANGRTYYGLYWEGKNTISEDFKDGFVVSKEDTISFLEEKLKVLGLTEREANEFIIYWLPQLEESNYNLIRFENIEEINKNMPLKITPEPDTIIRVLMKFKPLKNKITIKEQQLETPTRTGFTVVEWGGTKVE